ncbi:MAG: fibronectin type III domain-containing protein, partial [Promethearchaeota archaeon]
VFILGLLIVANSIIFGIILSPSSGGGVNAGNRGAGTNIGKLKGSSSEDITLSFNTTWGGAGDDVGYSIAFDSNNNIFITGYTKSYGAGGADVFLLKYNSNGNLLWTRTWGGAGDDVGYGIAFDSNNNIFITGATNSYGAGAADMFLLKYNSNGNLLWTRTWGGAGDDWGIDIMFDSNNNIFITGITNSYGAGGYDILLLKYINYPINSPILDKIVPNPNTDGNITLSWSSVEGASSYLVYRDTKCITDISNLTAIIEISGTTYNDTGLMNGTYYYVIVAKGSGGSSNISNCESVTVAISLASPILDKIVPNPDTDGNITLQWSSVEGANSYLVYRDTKCITDISKLTTIIEISGTTYNDTGLTNGTYYYVIVAKGSGGSSNISNCESVTVAIPPSSKSPRINGYSVYLVLIGILPYIYVFYKAGKHKVIKKSMESI